MMTKCRSSIGAYTLIELIVVLGAIGIIALSAQVRLKLLLAGGKLHYACEQIVETIAHQADIAAITGTEKQILFDTTAHAVFLLTAPSTGSSNPSRQIKLFQAPKTTKIINARFASLNNAPTTLVLRNDGSASPGSITVEHSSGKICVITQALRCGRTLTFPN
ncbi:MAG TPA: type II secretion system protein [Oligoflexia bacterium]|nr:type II secretion system protein [Oligoflexia bacterium]